MWQTCCYFTRSVTHICELLFSNIFCEGLTRMTVHPSLPSNRLIFNCCLWLMIDGATFHCQGVFVWVTNNYMVLAGKWLCKAWGLRSPPQYLSKGFVTWLFTTDTYLTAGGLLVPPGPQACGVLKDAAF